MTERKFALICKFLHFSNKNELDENTSQKKLFNIKPVLDHLQKRFMEVYIPEQIISIDESLVGWKVCLTWKQYIPSKRKSSIDTDYELSTCVDLSSADESESEYPEEAADLGSKKKKFALICKFLHFSNNNELDENTSQRKLFNIKPVQKRFMEVYIPKQIISIDESLVDKGYCLFLDNYYTSVDLAERLSKRRTDCVGTMRLNRQGIPKELKEKKWEHGEAYALFRKKIIRYKDKKEMVMISTLHDNQFVEKTKKRKVMKRPVAVEHYNKKWAEQI
ncbi:unnamed protein product [Acanthoscelides obtectus]|uniref:PiggyBac transposable element-derived protein domain-containing protein n=1 Tax=Acanthoscelides obtectus TaxID=200917 RepID=A0A9P0K8P8_ACAOB|nr:unnamed protein product [Acanthoscelides obtectus]CAK1623073.1 PiggyBac transposable element-derived protein 4 [Acanthoscelides obtectus]